MEKSFKILVLGVVLGGLVVVATGCGSQTPPTKTTTPPNPSPATQQSGTPANSSTSQGATQTAASGKDLFTQYCAGCHQNPPSSRSVSDVANIIKKGKGNMPAVGASLSDSQIQAISNYVVNGQ